MSTKAEEVREALKVVTDPEIGINIIDLGLVYDVAVSEDGRILVTYTLTSMGCPAGQMIEDDIKEAASSVEGVQEVETKMTFQPPWTPERMSDFARSALGFF